MQRAMVHTEKRGACIALLLIQNSAHKHYAAIPFYLKQRRFSQHLKPAPSIRHTYSNHSIIRTSLLASVCLSLVKSWTGRIGLWTQLVDPILDHHDNWLGLVFAPLGCRRNGPPSGTSSLYPTIPKTFPIFV